MNQEEQRVAIAEACGWTAKEDKDGFWRAVDASGNMTHELWMSERNVWSAGIPDFLHDLNAMHEAEEKLDCNQWEVWHRIVGEWPTELARLTASQRAEAFLRTIGKWKEANP